MPAMGHTLKNIRRWRSVLHMPQTWAFATGKSSQRNRAAFPTGRVSQAALRITRTTDHAMSASPIRNGVQAISMGISWLWKHP